MQSMSISLQRRETLLLDGLQRAGTSCSTTYTWQKMPARRWRIDFSPAPRRVSLS